MANDARNPIDHRTFHQRLAGWHLNVTFGTGMIDVYYVSQDITILHSLAGNMAN